MTLSDDNLPPLFQAADKSSKEAQSSFLWATRFRLIGLSGAALFGLFKWTHGESPVDWAGVLAAMCFVVALVVEGFLYRNKPERTWYEGRAAAESVKTLSWRYSVGGEPFNLQGDNEAAGARLFLSRLRSLFDVIKDLDLSVPDSSGGQITARMKQVRALPLADRKTIYENDRVGDQQNWYRAKASWNKRRANLWTRLMLVIEIAGVVFGILKAIGVVEGDVLTFSGVILASIVAWIQTKQHRTLATAYTVTALELASVQSKITDQNDETAWATFVNDAEEAFSREHTLWKASRGVQSS